MKNSDKKEKQKFGRDMDNSKIGGVCSGLATHWGISTLLVRILFVLFIYPIGMILYPILWMFTPKLKKPEIVIEIPIPDICQHCKSPNIKKAKECEWCGGIIC